MKITAISLSVLLVFVLGIGMIGCGGNSDDENGDTTPSQPTTKSPPEVITITIGNLTDETGVSSSALGVIDMALKDIVEYYNEENLIPGIKLEIVTFDGQWNPSIYVSGYEWLREQGADLLWSPVPPAVDTLKDKINEHKFVMFAATANMDLEEFSGGYIFSLGITPVYEANTLLKWLVENDPDFPSDRPAKIGGAAWIDGYSDVWMDTAQHYAEVHPEQYEWVAGYLNEFTFVWTNEAEGLKDCDYVYSPAPMHNFVKEYRTSGYTAKFLGTDVQAAFLGMIDEQDLWDDIDGMYFSRSSRWYNERGSIIDLSNKLLTEKHPDIAEQTRRNGSGYIAGKQLFLLLEIIKETVEAVGTENFDSQSLFDTATSFSFALDETEDFASFNEDKRYVQNYYAIYEARASEKDIFRADTEWIEQVYSP